MAERDNEAAVERRAAGPDHPVGEPSADDGQQVDRRALDRRDRDPGRAVDPESTVGEGVGDEVQQDGARRWVVRREDSVLLSADPRKKRPQLVIRVVFSQRQSSECARYRVFVAS